MSNIRVTPRWFALLVCTMALTVPVSRVDAQAPRAAAGAPVFKVDPSWPLDMPNHWIMGAVTGVFVDAKQHVWVTHLPETLTEEELYEEQTPPMGTCCKAAPPVLEFDAQGKLVQGWGQGSMDDFSNWPRDPHGIFVDPKTMVSGALPKQFSTVHGLTGSKDGNIYVADRRGNRIQVFDQQGKFVAEKVVAPATLSSGSAFVIALSPDAQEQWLYLADGTNHKIWILRRSDLEIVGEFGRGGRQVGQMLRPHGMSVDNQGNLYVGEASTGRRVQKFTLQRPGTK